MPQIIERVDSPLSGRLEIAVENGRLVMNSVNSNYSYGSLQKVFEIAFKEAPLPLTGIKDILILGMGGGCLVEVLESQPEFKASIVAVEADPVAADLGRKYFGEAYSKVQLVLEDAGAYLRRTDEKFDLVLVDLFVDRNLAPGCLDAGFISALSEVLREGGRVYHNLMLPQYELKEAQQRYSQVFSDVQILRVLALNQVLIASY